MWQSKGFNAKMLVTKKKSLQDLGTLPYTNSLGQHRARQVKYPGAPLCFLARYINMRFHCRDRALTFFYRLLVPLGTPKLQRCS